MLTKVGFYCVETEDCQIIHCCKKGRMTFLNEKGIWKSLDIPLRKRDLKVKDYFKLIFELGGKIFYLEG